MMFLSLVLAATLSLEKGAVSLTVDAAPETIDPARSVFVTVTCVAPSDLTITLPDLTSRLRGFSSVEELREEPEKGKDGRQTLTSTWKLVPEPCAETYRLAPFVVGVQRGDQDESFVAGPLYFNQPVARDAVEGSIEVDPQKDLPPFSWRLLLTGLCWVLGALVVLGAVFLSVRLIARRVKEHFLSPIERAWVELDRLLAKGLPGRGRYKDFYVELTMVVRRYVQRKYGVRAPNLTTEEFLREFNHEALRPFLESADLVKFAGVQATPEMAEEATARARDYLKEDDHVVR